MSRRPIAPFPTSRRALRWFGAGTAALALAACGGGGGGGGTINAPAPPQANQCPSTSTTATSGFALGVCINGNVAGEGVVSVRRDFAATVTTFPNPQTTPPSVVLTLTPAIGAVPTTWTTATQSALGNLNGVFAQSTPFAANDYLAIGDVSRGRLITATNPPVVTTTPAFGSTNPQVDLQFVQFGTWERFAPNGAGPLTGYYGSWLRGTVSPTGVAPAASYLGRFVGIYVSAVQRCSVAATALVNVAGNTVSVTLQDFFSNGTQCGNRPIAFTLNPNTQLQNLAATIPGGNDATFATPAGATELAGSFYGNTKQEIAGQLIAPITVQTSTGTINATIIGAFGAR